MKALDCKRLLTFFVLLCFAAPFVVGRNEVAKDVTSAKLSRVVELTTDGVKAAKLNGESDKAVALFRAALEIDSTYAPAHYSLMNVLRMRAGSLDEAVVHGRKAYELDSTNHWYLEGYADCLLSSGGYEAAAELYEELLKLAPRNLNVYRTLAIIYQQRDSVGEISGKERAVALLDSAEIRAGRNPYLVRLKQMMLLQSDKHEVAIAEAESVVAESPYDVAERLNLATLYGSVGRDSLAVVQFEQVLALDSTNFEALLSYGSFLEDRGSGKRYMELVARMVALDEREVSLNAKLELARDAVGDRSVYELYGDIVGEMVEQLYRDHGADSGVVKLYIQHLLNRREVDKALHILKGLVEDYDASLNEGSGKDKELQYAYLITIVDLEGYRKQADSVVRYLGRAVDLKPESVDLRVEYARILAISKRFDESVSQIVKARNYADADSLRSALWGMEGDYRSYVLKSSGQGEGGVAKGGYGKVYKAYDKALKYNERSVDVLNNYAYTLAVNESGSQRRLKQALDMAERVMEIEPNNAVYIDTHGWILYLVGRYEEARDELRRALAFDRDDNYEIALHYGEVLLVLGDKAMAEFYYKRAAQWGATQSEVANSRARVEAKSATMVTDQEAQVEALFDEVEREDIEEVNEIDED
ncbi:MAG: tetratricopeptide repeat protein [Rikenellaceae bacterium]